MNNSLITATKIDDDKLKLEFFGKSCLIKVKLEERALDFGNPEIFYTLKYFYNFKEINLESIESIINFFEHPLKCPTQLDKMILLSRLSSGQDIEVGETILLFSIDKFRTPLVLKESYFSLKPDSKIPPQDLLSLIALRFVTEPHVIGITSILVGKVVDEGLEAKEGENQFIDIKFPNKNISVNCLIYLNLKDINGEPNKIEDEQ